MRFFSNFGCMIIFICFDYFWHQQDSKSLFKKGIGHVTSQCKWQVAKAFRLLRTGAGISAFRNQGCHECG